MGIEINQFAPAADTLLDHPAAAVARPMRHRRSPALGQWRITNCAPAASTPAGTPTWASSAFGFGPGTFDVSHGPEDEFVEEAALRRVAAVYGLYAAELIAGRAG